MSPSLHKRKYKSNLYARRIGITCFMRENVTFLWLYFAVQQFIIVFPLKSAVINLYTLKWWAEVLILHANTFMLRVCMQMVFMTIVVTAYDLWKIWQQFFVIVQNQFDYTFFYFWFRKKNIVSTPIDVCAWVCCTMCNLALRIIWLRFKLVDNHSRKSRFN